MPIVEIYLQATRSRAATTAFTVVSVAVGVFCLNAVQQTSSRLTWALARDNAFLGSDRVARIHPRLHVPVWALLANFVVSLPVAVYTWHLLQVNLLSSFRLSADSVAFNALIGIGIVLQQVSFAFPAALLLYNRRSTAYLPTTAPFRLHAVLGWTANAVVVMSSLLWVVFFHFPVDLPITSSNMSKFRNFAMSLLLTGPKITLVWSQRPWSSSAWSTGSCTPANTIVVPESSCKSA